MASSISDIKAASSSSSIVISGWDPEAKLPWLPSSQSSEVDRRIHFINKYCGGALTILINSDQINTESAILRFTVPFPTTPAPAAPSSTHESSTTKSQPNVGASPTQASIFGSLVRPASTSSSSTSTLSPFASLFGQSSTPAAVVAVSSSSSIPTTSASTKPSISDPIAAALLASRNPVTSTPSTSGFSLPPMDSRFAVRFMFRTYTCTTSKDFFFHHLDEHGGVVTTQVFVHGHEWPVTAGASYSISCKYRGLLDFATRHYSLAIILIDRFQLTRLQSSLPSVIAGARRDEYLHFLNWLDQQRQLGAAPLFDLPFRHLSRVLGRGNNTLPMLQQEICEATWRGDGYASLRELLRYRLHIEIVVDLVSTYLGMLPFPITMWRTLLASGVTTTTTTPTITSPTTTTADSTGDADDGSSSVTIRTSHVIPMRSLPYCHGGLTWSNNNNILLLRTDGTCRLTQPIKQTTRPRGRAAYRVGEWKTPSDPADQPDSIWEGVYSFDNTHDNASYVSSRKLNSLHFLTISLFPIQFTGLTSSLVSTDDTLRPTYRRLCVVDGNIQTFFEYDILDDNDDGDGDDDNDNNNDSSIAFTARSRKQHKPSRRQKRLARQQAAARNETKRSDTTSTTSSASSGSSSLQNNNDNDENETEDGKHIVIHYDRAWKRQVIPRTSHQCVHVDANDGHQLFMFPSPIHDPNSISPNDMIPWPRGASKLSY